MHLTLKFTDVNYDQLADLVHCFSPVTVETGPGGGFTVEAHTAGGGRNPIAAERLSHWLLMQASEFERLFNASDKRMREHLATRAAGGDITEEASAEVKAFFDYHDPSHHPVAQRLAEAFTTEHAEWHDECDAGHRPVGVTHHQGGCR